MTATQPVFGGVADIFGRRNCTLATTLLFILGSVLCATAQNVNWLIAARSLQGIGSGGMDMAFSLVIVDIVPLPQRPMYVALLQFSAGLGLVFGGLIGAIVLERLSWRIIFWINVPIAAGPLLCFFIALHIQFTPKSITEQVKSLDWLGILLVTGSFGTILFAIFSGGAVYPWTSGKVLGPLIAGLLGLILFIFNEKSITTKDTQQPIVPLRLFGNRTAGIGYLITLIHGMSLTILSSIFPLYFYIVDGLSYIQTAVRMLPTPFVILTCVLVTGFILSKTQKFKWANVTGLTLLTIGFVLLFTLSDTSHLGQEVGYQVLYSVGVGILFVGRIMAVQSAQRRDEDVGLAAALVSVILNLGQCLGLALGVALFDNIWDMKIDRFARSGLFSADERIPGNAVQQNIELIKRLPAALKLHYRQIGAETCSRVFLVFAIISGVTLVLSLLSKNLSFSRTTTTKLIVQDLESSSDRSGLPSTEHPTLIVPSYPLACVHSAPHVTVEEKSQTV